MRGCNTQHCMLLVLLLSTPPSSGKPVMSGPCFFLGRKLGAQVTAAPAGAMISWHSMEDQKPSPPPLQDHAFPTHARQDVRGAVLTLPNSS